MTGFAVIGATTRTAKQAVKNVGCTHTVIVTPWDQLQPTAEGQELAAAAIDDLNEQITDARELGLRPIFEYGVQYAPGWAQASIEPFKDQANNEWLSNDPGKRVRNWMWTANGRAAINDLIVKVWEGLDASNREAIDRVRFGGGYYGELQYPPESLAAPFSYWGYGNSMQTGAGLAAGLDACPQPGYTLFSGTDAQDVEWINWYLDGMNDWLLFQVQALKNAGWVCDLMCLHPGYSIRENNVRSDAGFRQNMAAGQDYVRQIGAYAEDPQVWPWSTWINGTDPFPDSPFDSDQAAWKKLWAEAAVRGKHWRIWGENTGGETNAGMDYVFENALADDPETGEPIVFGPAEPWRSYVGMAWMNYDMLTEGGDNATLAHLGERIALLTNK